MYWILYLSEGISQVVDIGNIMVILKWTSLIKLSKCHVGQVGECKIICPLGEFMWPTFKW